MKLGELVFQWTRILILLATFALFPAMAGAQQETKSIPPILNRKVDVDPVTGALLITDVEEGSYYDQLPEEFKKRISKEQYDRSSQQAAADVFRQLEQDDAEFRLQSFSVKSLDKAISILKRLQGNKQLANQLGIVPEQLRELDEWTQRWNARSESLANMKWKDRLIVQNAFVKEFNAVLLPHQIRALGELQISKFGLPKMLTETQLGKGLNLTDQQRERIRSESQRIADELKAFMDEKRKEAATVVYETLSAGQRKTLVDLVGERELNAATNLPFSAFWNSLNYADDHGVGVYRSPRVKENKLWQVK